MSIVNIIQSMLVPGILISGCGLLLLATNNKYSLVISRIRALGEEKRKIELMEAEGGAHANSKLFELKKDRQKINMSSALLQKRLKSVSLQYSMLILRMKYLRNAVLCYHLAVAFFIFTCLAIGFQLGAGIFDIYWLIVAFLHIGILFMLASVYFGYREAFLGYEVLKVEVGEETKKLVGS